MSEQILKVKDLTVSFGGLCAVDSVNFNVNKGQITALIGPNGAGKTTIFNLLTGIYEPSNGEIWLDGHHLKKEKVYKRSQLGISRTFQNIRLFKEMSVLDNIKVAMDASMDYTFLSGVFRLKKSTMQEATADSEANKILNVLGLENDAHKPARSLPYGKQRKLEIARALGANPKLLLLDEPAAGMNPTESQDLANTIKLICKEFEVSILLIEHDMNFVMGLCEYIYVLDYGKLIAKGLPEEVRNNPKVIKAYLGGVDIDNTQSRQLESIL